MVRFFPGLLWPQILLFFTLIFSSSAGLCASYEDCLLRSLNESADTLSLGEIKASCRAAEGTDLNQEPHKPLGPEEGSSSENSVPPTYANVFSVSPHKQNYILIYSHNRNPNTTPYLTDPETTVDKNEITFQISLKFPIVNFQIGDKQAYLMAAYTAQSFWQAYNKVLSNPFRETNHEPEVFAFYPLNVNIPGARQVYVMGGFVHQSNGRGQPLSRSWNRLYLDLVVEGDNFKISVKPWYRLPEDKKEYIGASEGDDNPDITDYLGYGEISGAIKLEHHTLSFMLRNNLNFHDNKGALKLGLSFKMPFIKADNVKGYIQYFNGYGESMIDYNAAVERIGIGLMLADWL